MTSFLKEKKNRDAIVEWKKRLDDNRGERARLRRCQEPMQVLLNPSYYELKASIPDLPNNQSLALATVAGLLSIADHSGANLPQKSFATQLGSAKAEGSAPVMSESRFRQLIKSRDWPEFYRRMRRAIKMAGSNVNIISVADLVFQFGFEERGKISPEPSQSFQFRFAEDYFEASIKSEKTAGKKEVS